VSVCAARRRIIVTFVLRAGARLGVAGLFLLGANDALQTAGAEGDTRTLSFHHLHTDENITITFKRNGRYDEAALKKLDWFMRDWRRDQQVRMEPHLFDLLWETYREVGGTQPIQIICGFRSPETNSMLRARSSGVAKFSQHTQGQAIDFYIPGVALEKVRNVGLRLQRGGVGFYPSSGSPFVHMDVGSVRHWPRMTHDQLAKVFPDGRTVHIPSDGQPLAGYALALAEIERRGSKPSSTSLAAARDAGVITTASLETAPQKPRKGLLEGLFGGFTAGPDQDEESEEPAPKTPSLRSRTPAAVASATPPKPVAVEPIMPPAKPVTVAAAQIVPLPAARPKLKPAQPPIVTASLPGNLFDSRGYWRGTVEASALPPVAAASPFQTASADPGATGSTGQGALAYAAEAEPARPARARPMGASMPQLPREASVLPASTNITVPRKPPVPMAIGGQGADSPWLRAAMLTPSVAGFMTATRLVATDLRPLRDMLHKPPQALVMTFSADPHLGMVAERFSGSAVVFLATATFTVQTAAALR
jgi:uncharacterized protein YcbK (DUF882 family)